ncbi:MAG: hypothetical protein NSGCLCUN01_03095 [uncultured Clostridium sp.]
MIMEEKEEITTRREMEAKLISKFYDLSDEAETCATSDTESLINGMIKIYETLFPNEHTGKSTSLINKN